MNWQYNLRGWLGGESGQVLPLVAVAFIVLLGMAGLAIDVGHVFYCDRALQSYADAAALAGAGTMRTATTSAAVIAASNSLSSASGSLNAHANLPNVTVATGFPVLKCLATLQNQGIACAGAVPYNALQVQLEVTVPMYFAALFGINSMKVTAGATAASRGGAATPYNVAVLIDTSLSMLYPDADCGSTEIACAMNGLQVLLKNLTPCAASLAKCTITKGIAASAVDRVALFTFPDVSTATAAKDTTCTTAVPAPTVQNRYWSTVNGGATINYVMPMSPTGTTPVTPWSSLPAAMAYSFPAVGASSYVPSQSDFATYPMTLGTATYQVTQFLSDYRTSNATTLLNPNSTLVKAAGGVIGCGSMTSPNYDGVYGTYYAGAIYAAQSALMAQKALNPGTENVLIILSDGNATAPQNNGNNTVMGPPATSSGQYPSWVGECGQAVVAAKFATSQGTLVYSVAYGSEPAGCKSDQSGGPYPNINPCDTMAGMASATQYFYSDFHQSGSGSVCVAGQPVTSLSDIFTAISADLTTARLIPNDTP
ncbi:MAG TPA: pilus assembly protein TadG-related protein [Acidobacteriaceae bacterium]|nr:pilus assembly protein TadG-related protein [Acidobacteriaceae bacterium]